MRRARQISQLLFFALFVFLFLQARYPYDARLPSEVFIQASPLAALAVLFAQKAVYPAMLIAVPVLIVTLIAGRVFCGWVCPLGTLIDASDKLFVRKKRPAGASRRFRNVKYVVLIFILVAALFSVQYVGYFDPLALLWRTFAIVLYPMFSLILFALFQTTFQIGIFDDAVYALYDFAQKTILPVEQPHFQHGAFILIIFVAILVMGAPTRRFWCRNLCPLGALLALFSRHRFLNRVVDESCTQCGLCTTSCRMNAVSEDALAADAAECIVCGECVDRCPEHSIRYTFLSTAPAKIDLSKRRLLQAGLLGLTGAVAARTLGLNKAGENSLIRPPGALAENEFMDACVRCQECVKICASTGGCLQPAGLQAGWEGVWTPIAQMRQGYCEFNCTLCGEICPTGAIQKLALPEKQKTKIGRAVFDKDICIPWAEHKDCLVCEEHCPLPEKAIKFDSRSVKLPGGELRVVKLPYVVENLCIGCGICETKCPLVGKAGIVITPMSNEQKAAVV